PTGSPLQEQTRNLFVEPRRVVYNFHPPLLRALGLRRKLQLGPWSTPVLHLLRLVKERAAALIKCLRESNIPAMARSWPARPNIVGATRWVAPTCAFSPH